MQPGTWKSRIANHAPPRVREMVTTAMLGRRRRRNARLPVEAVFSEVYRNGSWGLGETYDSGSGSRGAPADRYVACVRRLVAATGARSVVDLGCGDFRVASRFVDDLDEYVGVDVVPQLIARNTELFGGQGVSFVALDATSADLPRADICLVRQVLQHLSNAQIAAILRQGRRFRRVVITEHWPAPDAGGRPNLDKQHGPDTRLDRRSWVDVTRPPFDCAPVEELLRVPVERPRYRAGETIRTHLWHPAER